MVSKQICSCSLRVTALFITKKGKDNDRDSDSHSAYGMIIIIIGLSKDYKGEFVYRFDATKINGDDVLVRTTAEGCLA